MTGPLDPAEAQKIRTQQNVALFEAADPDVIAATWKALDYLLDADPTDPPGLSASGEDQIQPDPFHVQYHILHAEAIGRVRARRAELGDAPALAEMLAAYLHLLGSMQAMEMPLTHLAFQHAAFHAAPTQQGAWLRQKVLFDVLGAAMLLFNDAEQVVSTRKLPTPGAVSRMLANQGVAARRAKQTFYRAPVQEAVPALEPSLEMAEEAMEEAINAHLINPALN